MKSINPKQIYYIAAICLLLILGAQSYLVYDYFQTTRDSLIRESDTILDEVFKKDLNARNKKFDHLIGTDTITIIPPPRKENTFKADISKAKELKGNAIGEFQLAINQIISKTVPMQLTSIDSIAGLVLTSRDINTSYNIKIVDPKADTLVDQSKKDIKPSVFQIQSKSLIYNYENSKALQLVMVNPFGVIIKRMGLMLITTLVLSIICLLAFGALRRILARQKQLIIFKNEFLGNIAHELKRPVASLTLNLDCIDSFMNNENNQQYALYIKNAINSTDEMNDTINMIVALTKMEEGLLTLKNESIDLQSLFLDLKNRFLQSTAKEVQINIYTETDNTHLMGDCRLLWQCFANIIDNAIKYSNNKVQVDITIRQQEHWMAISVKDNGRGISEDNLQLIFNKYSRIDTDNPGVKGFGIGLNYVKNIIEKHKGKINVSSKAGEGSEFTILLPG
jgi:signal transduction histidine kinase